ncbi:MAG: hypothetical protein JWQ71_3725 [Pedosphaera sp.]|nr:hypothetical protein [Pedosphaera sp.]
MNLYFQFFTQNQTSESVEIVRILESLVRKGSLGGRSKVSVHGETRRSTFKSLEVFAAKIAEKRFNQFELIFDPVQVHFGNIVADTRSFNCVFSPSPTCALWLPTREWRGTDVTRTSRNKYMTVQNKEQVLRAHHVTKEPSVLEVVLAIDTKSSPDTVLDACADWLAGALTKDFDKFHIFGCCDIGGPEVRIEIEVRTIAVWDIQVMANVKPPAYPILGDRFEALHPLMFGAKRVCQGINKALEKDASLTSASGARDFAVLRLPPTCDKESAMIRAAKWLINPADKTG